MIRDPLDPPLPPEESAPAGHGPAGSGADPRLPTLPQALTLYAVIASLFVVQGVVLAFTQKKIDATTGTDPVSLILTQVLVLFLPVILWARFFRWNVKATFRLRPARAQVLLYTAVASLAFLPLCQEVETAVEHYLPVPPFMEQLFKSLLSAHGAGRMSLTLLAVAVIPGVIEEALFRGIFLWALLRVTTPVRAVVGSALFFAIMHFNPWQFVGGFLLGSIYGMIAVWTGSLVPVMLAHMINNAAFVVLTNALPQANGPLPMPARVWLDVAGAGLSVLCLVRLRQLGGGRAQNEVAPA